MKIVIGIALIVGIVVFLLAVVHVMAYLLERYRDATRDDEYTGEWDGFN